MLPYIATLLVVAGVIGRAKPPRALGKPFKKE
jgi:nucleoside ABC transporter membrane protein